MHGVDLQIGEQRGGQTPCGGSEEDSAADVDGPSDGLVHGRGFPTACRAQDCKGTTAGVQRRHEWCGVRRGRPGMILRVSVSRIVRPGAFALPSVFACALPEHAILHGENELVRDGPLLTGELHVARVCRCCIVPVAHRGVIVFVQLPREVHANQALVREDHGDDVAHMMLPEGLQLQLGTNGRLARPMLGPQ